MTNSAQEITITESEKKVPYIGQIFYASCGYDQTNIDFYKVIKVSGTRVYYVKIGSKPDTTRESHCSMSQYVLPDETYQKELKKNFAKIQYSKWRNSNDMYFRVDDVRSAYEFDGVSKNESWYH